MYKGENAPPAFGDRVPGINSCAPVYRYGWIISRAELYEAINGEPCFSDALLAQTHIFAGSLFNSRWKEKGYDDNEYK